MLILTLVFGIIVLAVRYRTERRDSVDYLALAKQISDDQALAVTGLADLFMTLDDLERPDIMGRITRLDMELQDMVRLLEEVTVTVGVGEANGFFVVAASTWASGLSLLSDAIIEVLDGEGDGRLGVAMLDAGFADLRVGDRAYELFRQSLVRIDSDLVTRDYLDFGYVAGEREVLYDAAEIADRLRTTLRFVENRDVSVRATTDPEPLGSENGVRVVPDSDAFSVQVVVTNEGNVSVELITVMSRLAAAGGGESDERSEIVALLGPGEATTVLFADFVLVPGVVYELQVGADISDDDVPDNNLWSLILIRNEP